MYMRNNTTLWILGGAVLLGSIWWFYSISTSSNLAFDRSVWVDNARIYSAEYPRVAMVDDVLLRLQPGTSRADVIELLGEPSDTNYFSDWDLVYWLGPESSWFAVDAQWLVIRIVEDQLTETQILTD